jgi:triosephosphate isomerase
MKKIFIIANWKLYLSHNESVQLAESLFQSDMEIADSTEVVICPMYTALGSLAHLPGKGIRLGAQDVFYDSHGAFTGEIGPETLKGLGCEYAIIGHSERREHFNESAELINKKVAATLETSLVPILCVGEKREVREAGMTDDKIKKQLQDALKGIELKSGHLVIAYEPVWAIYPSKYEVDPQDVEHVAEVIEQELVKLFGEKAKDQCQILYGGSVNAGSIATFLSIPRISGALIGNASTKHEEFAKIVSIANQAQAT